MGSHPRLRVFLRCLEACCVVLGSLPASFIWAGVDVLAITGDAAPGVAGALLHGVSAGAINNAGQAAFRGTLQEGVGGVNSSNDEALWRVDGSTSELLAREGAVAPGGGNYASLQQATISSTGGVALRGTLSSGQTGLWRLSSPGSGTVAARSEDIAAPGVPGAFYESFGFQLLQSSSGAIAFNATMIEGVGGVVTTNNRGVWVDEGAGAEMLARSGVTETPGTPAGKFATSTVSAVNDAGQTATLATLSTSSGGVTPANYVGIWRLADDGGTLVARKGVSEVPGIAGALFDQFQDPVINSAGKIAFGSTLTSGVRGVWRYDEGSGVLIARTGAGVAPGTADAQFSDFAAPLLNDAGQALFKGTLAVGTGSVDATNNLGLWLAEPDDGALLARTGSGGVPGVAGGDFADFQSMALNAQGAAAVTATLAIGPGGVTADNAQGVWLLDAVGGSRLIARTGDEIAGRTIASVAMTGDSGGGDGRTRSLNDAGQLVFKATFTDGAEALLLYSPDSSADFDGDNDVDGDDLSRWMTNFGAGPNATNGQGDADLDGDVDGADFLVWQREVTGALSSIASSEPIPEPAGGVLALAAALAAAVRRKRAHCLGVAAALPWK